MTKRTDAWAIVQDDDNRCTNTTVWDGKTPWQPPEGTYLVNDYPISIGWYRDQGNEIWILPPAPLFDPETGEPVPGPVQESKVDQLGRTHDWLWDGKTWWLEGNL